MRKSVAAACLAALALSISACGGKIAGGGEAAGAGSDVAPKASDVSVDEMCALLPKRAVEQTMRDKVTKVEGDSVAREPITSIICAYDLANADIVTNGIKTEVSRTFDDDPRETLDQRFSDTDEKVIDYTRIDGLGTAAAFGRDALLGDLGGNQLVVTFEIADTAFQLDVRGPREATRDQLESLARQALPALTEKLGG